MNSFSFPLNSAILKNYQTTKQPYGGGKSNISYRGPDISIYYLSLYSQDQNHT